MGNINWKREDGISTIELNRPDSYNALDAETLRQFLHVMEKIKQEDDPIVILTGAGKAFSSGGDIRMMKDSQDEEMFDDLMDAITTLTLEMYTLPKIVIAAVNGSAAGLGMSVALNSDYIVAQEEAKFGMLFAGIGLIPDGGAHFFLKERLGTHHAKQFIWSLEQVKGEKAKKLGFVDHLTDGDALETAQQLAKKLQTAPLQAMIESKVIYHEKQKDRLYEYLQQEKQSQFNMRQTADHQEGLRAFLEKRTPNFTGK